jgi:hypothetical protein
MKLSGRGKKGAHYATSGAGVQGGTVIGVTAQSLGIMSSSIDVKIIKAWTVK